MNRFDDKLRLLGDSAPVLLWMCGADARCSFFNARWLEFTGRTLEQELGEGWAEGVHAEDFQRCMSTFLNAFVRREPFRMEYRLRRADGHYRWVLDTGSPHYDGDGNFVGYIGSCIDVTTEKDALDYVTRLIDELEQRIEERTAAIRARDEFLMMAAHELRTPLSALLLQLGRLERQVRADVPQNTGIQEKTQKAVKATDRLANLVNGLLDVSRAATGRLEIKPEDCDMAAIAADVVERMSHEAHRAEAPLRLHAHGPVPGRWDRLRLEQVLLNLVSNAIKYGDGKPIDIDVSSTAQTAKLLVRDHGIGISKEDEERIFARFGRAVSMTNYGGLGLGLFITKEIVAAHGGSIQVDSQVGEGAAFLVELPRWNGQETGLSGEGTS